MATIHKLVVTFLLLSGMACAEIPQVKVLNIVDASNIKDAAYQLCKAENFLRSPRDLERYLMSSKEIAAEQWSELDHYPCEKKITYLQEGVRYEIRVNLSGAGAVSIDEKTRFFACDTQCKKSAGWPLESL